MEWFFKPKVQLGLFVNLIFIMFTLVSSAAGGHTYDYRDANEEPPLYRPNNRTPPNIALPPPTGPSKAASYLDKTTGEINIYLDNDLDLIRRPGFLLRLSPTFTVRNTGETPRSVLLRFVSFSGAQYFSYDHSLTITADDRQVWPAYGPDGGEAWKGWSDEGVPHSVTFSDNGLVVETVGKVIPYEVFAKIISAKLVSIHLGPESTDLMAGQLGALRDMHRRLSQLPEQTHKHF
jgi:hypothetical protein